MLIRPYHPDDYEGIKALYLQGDLYGGQFDEARDAKDRIDALSQRDPESLLVCLENDDIIGTISLLENGRFAWLYRFAVKAGHDAALTGLHDAACKILRSRGHREVLVYGPAGHAAITARYTSLGMQTGGDYTCFWQALEQ